MNRAMFKPSGRARRAALRAGLVGALLALVTVTSMAQTPRDKYDQMQRRQSQFQLFAGATLVLQVNQYQCGIRSQGDTCSNVFNSPTGGGGFWPTGSPNQYMFNAGLNMAGIIPADAGFTWAGDTTGAFFFDARGTQQHGSPITQIFNSLDASDLAAWPGAGSVPDFPDATAFVTDQDLFNDVLLGREAASQQDSWVMYWDGDPAFLANRAHPMGITIEQRSLAWNFPSGNEATIYFIYKFTNVTDNALFQRLNEAQFFGGENGLPDAGWTIDSIYVSADFDPDVTADFDLNYSTAILPFNMGVAYEGEFISPDFTFFPNLFFPPFFTNAPGLVGAKYLQSPVDPVTSEQVGLTLFTVHENPSSPGAQFFDPFGVQQLWRYLSGNVNAGLGDPPCTFLDPKARRLCFLAQEPKDTRFLQASGPFSLGPGESQTVVVAQFAAATVATPLIVPGDVPGNAPGIPSLRPGCGGAGEEIRPIEVGAGWVSTTAGACGATAGVIDEFGVNVVTGSLLGKALVAQTIFNNKFLLGFAPDAPEFFLIPGDNSVTVVWTESPTEVNGDPFFSAAGDSTNALFNPNYREFDVEGYRIFRGADPSSLRLVAQFDKTNSVFVDVTCETDATFVTGQTCTETTNVDINGDFIQYPPAGVILLADSTTFVSSADTALAAEVRAGTSLKLANTGVPFAFADDGVQSGFQYFYKVTAFDINSLLSGPTSLESASVTKTVFPQAPASDLSAADFSFALLDRNGDALPAAADVTPTIDVNTGTFSGPQPPTEQLFGNFVPFAGQLLVPGVYEVRIDSVVPTYYSGEYFVTVTGVGQAVFGSPDNFGLNGCEGNSTDETQCRFDLPPISVPSDSTVKKELEDAGIEAPPSSGQLTSTLEARMVHFHAGDSDWAYTVPGFWNVDPPAPQALDGGSRWFSGENETMADPTLGLSWGELDEATVIFEPMPFQSVLADPVLACNAGAGPDHMRRFYQSTWLARRAADIKIYWGAAGVDSVIDVTHNLPVRFSPAIRASYGFITDADGNGTLDYKDVWFTVGLELTSTIGCASSTSPASLASAPVILPTDVTGDRVSDGQGFGLYIAGEPFYFQASAIPSNTVWTYRSYSGIVSRGAGGKYTFVGNSRTPGVPGLRFAVTVEAASTIAPETADLTKVHTVPDPYYTVSRFDLGPTTKRLRFVNLPAQATIRIFTLGGVLVDVINHNDPSGGGQATWNLRNRSGQFVASGVYFYHLSTPDGKKHLGKFTIVNFAN